MSHYAHTHRIDKRAKRAAKRGAKLLDKHYPGWHRQINDAALRMINYQDCILGQLTGDYERGVCALKRKGALVGPMQAAVVRHGFYSTAETQRYWHDLESAWTNEINQRRQQEGNRDY